MYTAHIVDTYGSTDDACDISFSVEHLWRPDGAGGLQSVTEISVKLKITT